MESIIYLDTHVIIWLYTGRITLLTEKARNEIKVNQLLISPVVRLELKYLYEIGKISKPPEIILNELNKEIGLKETNCNFIDVIQEAIKFDWTRDPFDRLIIAQASINNARLLTKDSSILENYKLSFWE